jgi:hypothetical protein
MNYDDMFWLKITIVKLIQIFKIPNTRRTPANNWHAKKIYFIIPNTRCTPANNWHVKTIYFIIPNTRCTPANNWHVKTIYLIIPNTRCTPANNWHVKTIYLINIDLFIYFKFETHLGIHCLMWANFCVVVSALLMSFNNWNSDVLNCRGSEKFHVEVAIKKNRR